jgi:hypothetical protein
MFSAEWVFTILSLLKPAFSLDAAPVALAGRPSLLTSTLPYHSAANKFATKSIASVLYLAPLNRRRKTVQLVSCYAFFKGWLLLSQPPSCLNGFTSLPT